MRDSIGKSFPTCIRQYRVFITVDDQYGNAYAIYFSIKLFSTCHPRMIKHAH